jgi:wyosine [tRNA(Phe)-imidazoG37] synthetase (radical SAM superfamily)
MQVHRRKFYQPDELLADVEKLLNTQSPDEKVDFLTFVPDGEPTLDINLGQEIEMMKGTGVNIAVISNASLIWMEEVSDELQNANWVSLKVDAFTPEVWQEVDRPQGSLIHQEILDGIVKFSKNFRGKLVTETMLVDGINDSPGELEKIASFLKGLDSYMSYISIPIRPPAEASVLPPPEDRINTAFQIFTQHGLNTELLTGYEGNTFGTTGNVENDLLAITSVHPMRQDAVDTFLEKAGTDPGIVNALVKDNKLTRLEYAGNVFYLRRFGRKRPGDGA